MSRQIQLQEAFKLALSMMLTYWFALWMDWDMPRYGGLAILLCSLGTTGASLQKGLMRIAGTTFGLGVGFLAVACFSQDRWLNMLFLSSYLVAISYFMQESRYGYAWFVAGVVPVIVWSTTYMKVDTAFHYGTFRYLETTTGVIIYTLISALLWPRRAGDQLNQQGKDFWEGLRRLFGLYRRQLAHGQLPAEASNLRLRLAGTLLQMSASLQAAYSDTPSVIAQKRVWEGLRVNTRALVDALVLWRESIDDCRQLNLERLLPELCPGLDTLVKRLERLGDLWQERQDSGTNPESDDGELLTPLRLDIHDPESLSPFERAALMSFVQQLQILDQASRELLRTLRVLAKLDPSRKFRVQPLQKDLYRPSRWQPERLIKALFPAICFIAAYVFWIYVNPPTGQKVPEIAAIFAMFMVLAPMNPLSLMVALLVSQWVVVAPIYFFVMPWLDSGSGLLALIFVYTFVFGYLGGRSPLLKFGPIFMLVESTGISNQQSYSFTDMVNSGMMWFLALGIIGVVHRLLSPIRPEKILLNIIRRFFHGCARITGGFALYLPGDQVKGRKLRKRYFESMVVPVPRQVQAEEKKLDYKRFPDNNAEKVKFLQDTLQSIVFRLEALELAHDRVARNSPDLIESLSPLGNQLRERLELVFESWSRFELTDALEVERSNLQKISRELEQRLDARGKMGERHIPDDRVFQDFYALLGSVRGLIETLVEAQDAMRQINWDQWAAARF